MQIADTQVEEYSERSRILREAAKRLTTKLVGCWPHDLSRPFQHHGKTYRVCFKCEKFQTVR
jgi:hypothetical protein